jgi:hypothetical protein
MHTRENMLDKLKAKDANKIIKPINDSKYSLSNCFIFSGFLVFSILAYLLPVTEWFSGIPGDLGDARFNIIILEHVYGWVIGRWGDLWSPIFFFPYEGALGFSDNHFGSASTYILLRLSGLNSVHAFSGWFSIGCILNFISAYWVFRKMSFSALSAASGAFVFTFSLPFLAQSGHAQLVYRFAIPLAFFSFWELLSQRNISAVKWVLIWTTWQFYCSIYLGLFLAYLFLAMYLASFFLGQRKLIRSLYASFQISDRNQKVLLGVTILLCTTFLLTLLIKYKLIAHGYGFEGSEQAIAEMLPRLKSYLISDFSRLSSWVGARVGYIPSRNEHQMFFGIGVSILFLLGVWLSWTKSSTQTRLIQNIHLELGRLMFISLAILILMTLKIGVFSLYSLPVLIPGVMAIRAVSRVVLIMALPVSVLVVIFCQWAQAIKNPTKKYLLIFFILLLLGAEFLFFKIQSVPNTELSNRQYELQKLLPENIPADSILYVTKKKDEPFYLAELDGMVLSQKLGIPTLNGYSGQFPYGDIEPDPCKTFLPRLNHYAALRNKPNSFIDEMAKKVIVLSPEKCPDKD